MNVVIARLIPILLLALVFTSCGEAPAPEQKIRHNYVVLLDLSDRLLARADQAQRDQAVIRMIFDHFATKVRQERLIGSKDCFQVMVAPQKRMPLDPVHVQERFVVDMASLHIREKKSALRSMNEKLDSLLRLTYAEAIHSPRADDYEGADLWQVFNELLPAMARRDTEDSVRNLLFVITDGYLDFETGRYTFVEGNRYTHSRFLGKLRRSGWREKMDSEGYGLLPPSVNRYPDWEVAILEVAPKVSFLEEYALLSQMWEDWLGAMKISRQLIVQQEALSQTERRVVQWIDSY